MAWAIHYLHPFDRRLVTRRDYSDSSGIMRAKVRIEGRRENKGGIFWTCLEYGSMGWAIGSAIGTAMACADSPVVCITGDGSMLMSGGDVTVALQQKLKVIFLILNDSEYGMVKHGQNLGTGESIGYQLPPVDFVKWGESLGISAYCVKSSTDLLALDYDLMTSRDGPTILDVYIDPEEVPPLQSRLQSLGSLD
jgi:acetolactate synthase-1/2/3 large subunit